MRVAIRVPCFPDGTKYAFIKSVEFGCGQKDLPPAILPSRLSSEASTPSSMMAILTWVLRPSSILRRKVAKFFMQLIHGFSLQNVSTTVGGIVTWGAYGWR